MYLSDRELRAAIEDGSLIVTPAEVGGEHRF